MTEESSESRPLCTAETYKATAFEGKPSGVAKCTVCVIAIGAHPTAGYKTYLEKTDELDEKGSPVHRLEHVAPPEPGDRRIMPFVVSASFQTSDMPRSVKVTDAGGEHTVHVEPESVGDLPDEPSCKG